MSVIYQGGAPKQEIFQIFSETMAQLFQEDHKVVYLDADLMGSMKTQPLWQAYPKRVFNCGIQEADMVGVACGLYLAGYKPYIHSFSPFLSRRVYDQVFLSVGYGHKSVRLIGSDAGIMATYNGGTHMCLEDMALMRAIPEACVVDVSDGAMFAALLRQTKDRPGVIYFRTPRRDLPDIYGADTVFEEGHAQMLRTGRDVTIVASGIMVATALQAADALAQEGIFASVLDPITVKPLEEAAILASVRETGAAVTAENHNVIGGLGSAVAELLCEKLPAPLVRVGVRDQFGQVGNEAFLRGVYGLTAQEMIQAAKAAISAKKN
ncbi:transketolase C-terminal domain-containing protein [Oscillibacter sp.]|uniref:transketolase family protein n=1 Tax=Oscillibacter sp. TaxID=1945593 RepID=UPI00289AC1F3|nr:transketolase C-terminal domain-containing protein [Oscillibacter sp.]